MNNGKIVAKITPGYGGNSKVPVSTRAGVEVCEETCFINYKEICEDKYYWEYDEWGSTFVIDRHCYTLPEIYCYNTCWWTGEGNDGNDDDNWQSPNPPGGVNPPSGGGGTLPGGNNPYVQGQEKLMSILPQIERHLRFLGVDLNGVTVRFSVAGEVCASNAQVINGEIVVCNNFFNYESKDQASIIWHELYHIKNDKPLSHSNRYVFDSPHMLNPPNDIYNHLRTYIHSMYPDRDEGDTIVSSEYPHRLTIESLNPSDWYKNEIATYEAERYRCIDVSDGYRAEREFMYWRHLECLKLAEKYNK